MPEPAVYEASRQFRQQILANERRAAAQMLHYYGGCWQQIRGSLDALQAKIADARAAGQDVSPAWLFQQGRLNELREQVEQQIKYFAQYAEQTIVAEQREAVDAATAHAEHLAWRGVGSTYEQISQFWDRLPTEACSDLIGFLQDGSPLHTLLDELPGQAGQRVSDALVQGLATGQGPREIARRVRREAGMPLVRALRIARTETMRAYNEATRRNYEYNRDIVKGWYWEAKCDTRTCPACWSMHGSYHKLEERLDDHIQGRCVMVPETKTWKELGFGSGVPETAARPQDGEARLWQQTEEVQRAVLGNAGYEAWKSGKITLRDFVGRRTSTKWGTMRYTRSLKDILGKRAATAAKAAAAEAARKAAAKAAEEAAAKAATMAKASLPDLTLYGRQARERVEPLVSKYEQEHADYQRRIDELSTRVSNLMPGTERRRLLKQMDDLYRQSRMLDAEASREIRAALEVPQAERVMFKPTVQGTITRTVNYNRQFGEEAVEALWRRGKTNPYPVSVYQDGRVGRAHASWPGYKRDAAVHLFGDSGVATAVHEYGHIVEFNATADQEALRHAFWAARTQGETAESLATLTGDSGYGPNEYAYKDKFLDVYMGHLRESWTGPIYTEDGVELISMGVERLYTDPVGLIRKDPEYFDFLVSFLQG